LLFPFFFNSFTLVLESNRPKGAIVGRVFDTIMHFNLIYLALALLILLLCYVVLPLIVFFVVPEYGLTGQRVTKEEESKKKYSLEEAAALVGAGRATAPPPDEDQGGQGTNNGSNGDEGPQGSSGGGYAPEVGAGLSEEYPNLDEDPQNVDRISERDYLRSEEEDRAKQEGSNSEDDQTSDSEDGQDLPPESRLQESDGLIDLEERDQLDQTDEVRLEPNPKDSPVKDLEQGEEDTGGVLTMPEDKASLTKPDSKQESAEPDYSIPQPSMQDLDRRFGVKDEPESTDRLSTDYLPESRPAYVRAPAEKRTIRRNYPEVSTPRIEPVDYLEVDEEEDISGDRLVIPEEG
jgi:hypothetical protein